MPSARAILSSSTFLAAARPCVSDGFNFLADGRSDAKSLFKLVRSSSTRSLMVASSRLFKLIRERLSVNVRVHAPIIFQLELQFQAFYLNLTSSLVVQNALIRFSVLGGSYTPGSSSVCGSLVHTKCREIAHNIAICTAVIHISMIDSTVIQRNTPSAGGG